MVRRGCSGHTSASRPALAGEPVRRGEVKYVPPANEANVPERFRLAANHFSFEQRRVSGEDSRIEIFQGHVPVAG